MAKRTYPWLMTPATAATLPSTSPSSRRAADADRPATKKSRLLAPFPATDEYYATKTAASDAEEAIASADADADADASAEIISRG
jgi:hypothetical protein